MKRTWDDMTAPVQVRIEKMNSIMDRIKLSQDNKDYVQITQLWCDFDDATGP
jgi:hypothetical protein